MLRINLILITIFVFLRSSDQSTFFSFDIVEPANGQTYIQGNKMKIMTRISVPGVNSLDVLETTLASLYQPPLTMCASLSGDFSTNMQSCSQARDIFQVDLVATGNFMVTAWLEDGSGHRLSDNSTSNFVVQRFRDSTWNAVDSALLEAAHQASLSSIRFFSEYEARTAKVFKIPRQDTMVVWPESFASSRGIHCDYDQCIAKTKVLDKWPFTYFLTSYMLKHIQEFEHIGSMMLHLPVMAFPLTVQFCSAEEADDINLDLAQMILKATQVLSKASDGSSFDRSPHRDKKRLYITASKEFQAHPCRRHDKYGRDNAVEEAVRNMPPQFESAIPLCRDFANMVVFFLRHTAFCIETVHISADSSVTVVARPRSNLDDQSTNASFVYAILGERNSGTTWIGRLFSDNGLPQNIQQVPLTEWKHAAVEDIHVSQFLWPLESSIFILCVKSPLAWAVSMYDNPFHTEKSGKEHQSQSLAGFLSSPWITVYNKSSELTWHERFVNVAAFRTIKLRSHMFHRRKEFGQLIHNFHVLRYEDALTNPITCVQNILHLHGLKISRHRFQATEKKMSASGSIGRISERFNRKEYYLEGKFLLRYDKPAYRAFALELDKSLEASIGYSVPSWKDVQEAHFRHSREMLEEAWLRTPISYLHTE